MKIRPGLAVSESGFLFDPSTGESYSLNEMGVRYFNWISEGKTVDQIKELVMEQYDADEITFEKSFIDFWSRLKFLHLVDNE